MLERFADLESMIETHEAMRNVAIAEANQLADAMLAPLVAERDAIRAKLEPWWSKAGAALTKGARKSIELGGCIIGTRAGPDRLHVRGTETDLLLALKLRRWGQRLVRIKTSLDRRAALRELSGPHGDALRDMGLSIAPGEEIFVLERAEQAGTIGAAA